MLPHDSSDKKIEVPHSRTCAVQLPAHARGLFSSGAIQGQDFQAADECEAPIEDFAPMAVARPKKLPKGGSWDGEPLLIGSPRDGPFLGMSIAAQEVEAVGRVQGPHSRLPDSI